MTATLLRAADLTLKRGERFLFADLSFAVLPGEALILRGPNGVGKTSLLRLLAGLAVADAGEVYLNEQKLAMLSPLHRAAVLYVGHANALKDELSAEENLADQLALDTIETTLAVRLETLKQVGLLDRRQVAGRKLSQGQKRRIGMARMMLSDRKLWLLDEPTNALDDAGVALLLQTVDSHLARGGIAVIATHLTLPLQGRVKELVMQEAVR